MSAFLGPIHFLLYHKIQRQEELIGSILETARQEGWTLVSVEKLDMTCGKSDMMPLESVIDQGNIHRWLHHRISISEMRLAFLVTELLTEDSTRLATLEKLLTALEKNIPWNLELVQTPHLRFSMILFWMECLAIMSILYWNKNKTKSFGSKQNVYIGYTRKRLTVTFPYIMRFVQK